MIWFLSDLERLARERAAVADLEARAAGWLTNIVWRIEPALVVDADIVVSDRAFPVTLRYPYAFPHCPPSVFPRGVDERWSFHQYGKGGELCLEWGPDNWHPDLTAADLFTSAFKLLSLENPLEGASEQEDIPSRHATTLAQGVRGKGDRFIATRALMERLAALPIGVIAGLDVSLGNVATSLAVVFKVQIPEEPDWLDPTVPVSALDGLRYRGAAVRLAAGTATPPVDAGAACFRSALDAAAIDLTTASRNGERVSFVLLLAANEPPLMVWLPSAEGDGLFAFSTVQVDTQDRSRLPPEYVALAANKIGLVGCGSLGSKIAVSLARAGVGAFVLIDDDLFVPANLVRSELDWRDIGMHKVDALARRLALVNPAVRTTLRRVRLNGQEASGTVARALRDVAACDVIIDATADPSVFNMLAAIAAADRKMMVWGEVFAGGIGGLIARYLPGRTPPPLGMRAAINAWYISKNIPWLGRDAGYMARTGDAGAILVADDSDVASIAVHITRMAVDGLLGREPLLYPYAVYLIGLKPAWAFEQPFDTQPIDVGPSEEVVDRRLALPADRLRENIEFITGLIESTSL